MPKTAVADAGSTTTIERQARTPETARAAAGPNEARFRVFAEAAFEAIGIHRDGVLVDCNEAFEQLLARPRVELIGTKSLSLVAPESRELVEAQIQSGAQATYEILVLRPDGERRAVEVRARNIVVEGVPSRITAMRDITDRLLADREQRFQQTLLDETQAFAHVGSWELDLDAGTMQGTAETRRLFSLDADEAATQETMISHIHPDDRSSMRDALAAAVATGAASVETRIVRHDGSTRWVFTQKEVRRNTAGRPTRLVGISQDITERKLQADAAAESQRRLAGLLENLSDVFYSLDAETRQVLIISRACATLYGLPPKAFYDNPRQWVDLVHPEDALRVLDADAALRKGAPQDVRYRIRRADGAIRSVRDRMTPVHGPDGRIARIEGYVSDVTAEAESEAQRLRVHELEQVAAFKSDLLNAASHELNTPLSAMKLQLYLHRNTLGDRATPADNKALDMMDRNLTRLVSLINETLDVSRIESKTLRLNRAVIALDEVARETIDQLTPLAEKAGVTLEVVSEGPVTLDGDALRLSQVFVNLISNALKFVPRGGRVMVVTSIVGDRAHCIVKDTGPGLRPEQIARLFQPFTQVHDQREPRGGTGLGLFISRGIVEEHGGRIWCESAGLGSGCSFCFEIPLHGAGPSTADRHHVEPIGRTAGRILGPARKSDEPRLAAPGATL